MSIGRAITEVARREPTAVALRHGSTAVTRAELDDLTDRVAAAWVRDGVAVDDVVALARPGDLAFVVAVVAAWKAGATPAPLSPLLPVEEQRAALDLLDPALVVGPGTSLPVEAPRPAAPLPDRWASSWKAPTSSGSTGRVKVVRAAAPALVDPDRPVATFVPHRAVQLVASPLWHAAPFVYAMRGLMTGHELVVLDDPGPEAWLAALAEHRCTWGMVVPSLMRAVADHPAHREADTSSLESVLHLGARCPETVKRAWLDWLGPGRVWELYAGTEAQGLTLIGGEEWLAHPGSVGRAVGGTELRVERPDGSECAPGEVGEVRMRRAEPTYTYVGAEPDVRDGWHTLGDAGWVDEDGHLHLSDRLADLVRIGEGWVAPSDVEEVLEEHPGVRAAVVVGRDGALHAVAETDGDLPGDLDAWAAARLAPDQRPVTWEATSVRLRSPAGKARRGDWR